MPPESSPPDAVVQRQLDAYNTHDLDAWIATYAPDAQQFEHPAKLLASGVGAIRARTAPRFAEPDLHARLIKRTVAGQVVVDHEIVTRNFDAGVGTVEMVCIYVVKGDLIQSASFVFGSTVMRGA
jgi:hypothetical protein